MQIIPICPFCVQCIPSALNMGACIREHRAHSVLNISYDENKMKWKDTRTQGRVTSARHLPSSKSHQFIRTSKILLLTLQQMMANLPPLLPQNTEFCVLT